MSTKDPKKKILVLGSGNFGTCLAHHLAEQGHDVTIVSRSQTIVDGINKLHKNPRYLSTITLSPQLKATASLDQELLRQADVLTVALPTQALRDGLCALPETPRPETLIVCAAKGIETKTGLLPIGIFKSVLPENIASKVVFLSGPSFAEEIAIKHPTAVVVGSLCKEKNLEAQRIFHSPYFRTYTSNDPIGLELAGALKNVIAIAAGAAAGLGFQSNTQAALLTRGLNEIMRMGVALGANPQTFIGLGGVGDLFLTCKSPKSRNYRVGWHLARKKDLSEILQELGSFAEGVPTALSAKALAEKLNVDTPIIREVAAVLFEKKDIQQALNDLINREPKPEHHD